MLLRIYRGSTSNTCIGIARLSYNTKSKYIDSDIISNRDLYISNPQINTTKKIPNKGTSLSFYSRSSIDFESEFLDIKDLGDTRILEVLDSDKDFSCKIEPRTKDIQRFLGDEFPLSLKEKLSILCGLSNFSLNFDKDPTEENVAPQKLFPLTNRSYTTDKLRSIGKSIFDLHIGLSTVFANQTYLSLSSDDIEHSIEMFNTEKFIIPSFMKRNLIYNCILPYRGAMRSGPIHSYEEYERIKSKILDRTCIGSFYTMIGLVSIKFDRNEVLEKVLYGKIINGPTGFISLATERITRTRS